MLSCSCVLSKLLQATAEHVSQLALLLAILVHGKASRGLDWVRFANANWADVDYLQCDSVA